MRKTFLALLIFFLFTALKTTVAYSATQKITSTATSSIATRNFWELNNALSTYQELAKEEWPIIPDDPAILKRGSKNQVVLMLRERLRITGDLLAQNDSGKKYFDNSLSEAVMNFQNRHGIRVDGVVGPNTRAELNVSPQIRIKQIAINMQRWANLANKLGDRFVMVNIPDFHLYLVDGGRQVLNMKAIVGKRDLPTPEITSKITQLEFNPYWNIPSTIAKRDIAPKMLADPDYAYKNHIRVLRIEGDEDSEISPDDVNWHDVAENGTDYHLRQDSGPDDALGQVKFVFQNTKDVYLHDTPAKNLFDQDIRDFSHGCVRLENPFALVDYLMKDAPNWSQEKQQEILDSGENKWVRIPDPIPIYITYITAWVDGDGHVNFRDDLYQLDDPDERHVDQNDQPQDM